MWINNVFLLINDYNLMILSDKDRLFFISSLISYGVKYLKIWKVAIHLTQKRKHKRALLSNR